MRVGVPKEIKNHECRVGLTPASVAELTAQGHEVLVEALAGNGIDFSDRDYMDAGARILPNASEVFAAAEMIVKVKEPQPSEIAMLRPHHTLFTYLHLAADKPQGEGLMKSGATCIAYETVTSRSGQLPLLKPMSEVAGRMSVQVGAHYLEKEQGGRGVLLGGVPGVAPARVAILGGGVSGVNAAQMAVGMRADVTIYDINMDRLAEPDQDGLRVESGHCRSCRQSTSGDRRGPRPRCCCSQTGDARHAQNDEARLGPRRHRHRSGRLFRDQPRHDARRPRVRDRRYYPLLRGQYARRGRAHVGLRTQQCDTAIRRAASQPRRRSRDESRPALGRRFERRERPYPPPGRRRRPGLAFHPLAR
jgi:Alanine dehydrogenase/PNT, N-terminal domain/Alanine dehydrogenase/PNT, C-terminal domain